ncbi:hypothetical protein VIGAN_05158800 [Vigna angularis var. angularis]|uniref:Uncharacterized protein n=1 Tax=Vigna angularis var. angularis TaxID=157739 RepID=A0A0S3S5Q6_PHAAN|nr:hypothetical protein VIGAN_05158800 [Vigna angularis var. angularis]
MQKFVRRTTLKSTCTRIINCRRLINLQSRCLCSEKFFLRQNLRHTQRDNKKERLILRKHYANTKKRMIEECDMVLSTDSMFEQDEVVELHTML